MREPEPDAGIKKLIGAVLFLYISIKCSLSSSVNFRIPSPILQGATNSIDGLLENTFLR